MSTSSIVKPLSIVAAMALAAPGALALTHTGGASLSWDASVKKYDATNAEHPILTAQTEPLAQSGAFVFAHDALFVAVGTQVRRYDGRDLSQPATASWNAGSAVRAITDGPERGLALVLDAKSLSLVRFPDGGAPATVWAIPIDEAAGASPGRVLVRDGNRAFVADASIPGFRVVTIDPDSAPETLAIYKSPEGVIQDMSLWGRRLALATESGLVVLGVAGGDAPVFERLGARTGRFAATRVDTNSKYALVADGRNVSVFGVDPDSGGFLADALGVWQAPGDVRSVRLDAGGRAYVLVDGAYEILDIAQVDGR